MKTIVMISVTLTLTALVSPALTITLTITGLIGTASACMIAA